MNKPDVDDVINYLSIKFNKIFCERDFVCCVIEDFQIVLNNKSRCCVLLFPTLGPVYLKALRYQAKIFDLATFNVSFGRFRSLAVCHKDHLQKKQVSAVKEVMAEVSISKRKRPERQLYVPPAQRRSRLSSTKCEKQVVRRENSINNNNSENTDLENEKSKDCELDCSVLNLSDLVNILYDLNQFPYGSENSLPRICYQHGNCEFKRYLDFKKLSKIDLNYLIPIYNNEINENSYNTDYFQHYRKTKLQENSISCPVFNLHSFHEQTSEKPSAVLSFNQFSDFQKSIIRLCEFENSFYKIVCDEVCDIEMASEHLILDLSYLNLGHYFIVDVGEEDYFYQCQEEHDPVICFTKKKEELEYNQKMTQLENINNQELTDSKIINKDQSQNNKEMAKNKLNNNTKEMKVSNTKNEHEQEKEIMRKTKENINRKTRPIMKYVDDTNDTLKIDKDDSVNNWEDLFDDDGQIQEGLFTEIVEKVGDEVTILTATEDYTQYTTKPPEELEHVVELYNFPSTLETHDLIQAFSDINSDALYVKWVDDTHALLVLGSTTQAQKAMSMKNPMIKVRPMTAASAISMDVACKSDLRPAMKRPATNLQTARRLITTHLGTKSKLSKEQIAKEKQDLKNAREQKRLIKQNQKDAWEGNIRSSLN